MMPLIFVSNEKNKVLEYLKNNIKSDYVIFEIVPQKEKYSIDDIRDIKKETIIYFNKLRIYIFDNFHNSSFEAQNSFLKILEETPSNVLVVLTVDNQYKLLPTILSRGKIIHLNRKTLILEKDKELILSNFLKNKNLDLKIVENVTIDDLILFFKKKVLENKKYLEILNEALEIRSLIEKNNLNFRLALDHLLIKIYKT
ncbi:MAG: hypothetical protein KatS3mg092_0861 [Patescibacteria group bacterium]|nr:MAG: hypothetical protein KatS3mg092_0861 [Patescibacteria group bacterium]